MIWVILTALTAVCGAAKLQTNYLPPISARTAGGSAGALLAPFDGTLGLPTGSYTNDAQGVVVDAVNPGTRTSGLEPTGLGGPRTSYGSKDSKVGDAAFGVSGSINPLTRIAPGFGSFVQSDELQADKASGNSLKFTSDIGLDKYSYGFETDNGISVGENGESAGAAAGYVNADGSYDAQKHNDEGDYTSNSAGNNNGRPTIGGGDATSSGSYVSQSGQRPTSGVLVGSYKPGSVGSISSQGHSAQGFGQLSGNKQSSFGINKDQSGSQGFTVSGGSSSIGGQFGQAGSKDSSIVSHDQLSSQTGSSQSTENRFGVQTLNSEGSHAHASAGSPVRTPSIHNGASAFSSAVAKGSGSASAFASTAPFGSGLKNEYLPPSSSFGSAGQHTGSGSDSSAGASFSTPSTATASASVLGSQTLGSQTHSHSNLPSSGSASASVSGNQHSYEHLNQQQAVPSRFAEGQQVTFASSTQKPFIGQQQGPDDSYYYKQPSKPFIIPTVFPSGQNSINRQPNVPVNSISQQGSKYQGTSSPSYNGITQASISPFPSGSLSSSQFASQSSQFGSKPSIQLGQTSQPTSTQFGSTEIHSGHKVQGQTQLSQSGLQAPAQFGSTETHPGQQTQGQTQFGQSSTSVTSDSSKSPTQQYHGTIYQYNKPATTLSGNKVQGQTLFGQSGQQTTTQFGSTETHSGHKVQGQAQFVQSSLQVPTQSGSTETHFGHQTSQTPDSSHSPTQQHHGTIYQYNKPATTLPAQGYKDTSSFAQVTATGGKPGQVETDSRFGTQQSSSQFGSQSTFQQTQTGSNVQTSQFGQKPIDSSQESGSKYQFGSSGSKPQTTQGSSFTYSQSQPSQFGKKPVASSTQTGTQFGSSSSQFGQNSQSTQGSGAVSATAKPFGSSYQQTQFGTKPQTTQGAGYTYSQTTSQTSQFGKKPVSTAQTGVTSQQTQFGSFGSQFGQNSQSSVGAGSVSSTVKPAFGSPYQQTQFGSKPTSFIYTQGQTSQFEKKPIVSTTQTGAQQTQFGSSSYQFGQNSQSTFGAGSVSNTVKPIGSSYQQTGSQFGQNVQSSSGTGSVSTTVKPALGSSYQQTQFGSKPSTSQGSSFTYTQSQTSQYGKKPVVSTTQTGTQFGSGSQFGQNSQSTYGSGSVSTTAKPIGSSFEQTQFGSPGSQFVQNAQSSTGIGSVSTTVKPAFGSSFQQTQFGSKPTSFTYTQGQTSQFGKKPAVSSTQTGAQQTQFGSSSYQFGQNSQSTFGSGLVSTTAKPFGSSYQQTGYQFGQNTQSIAGAGSVSTTVKPAFGSSYQQTQFGSKPSASQGSSLTYTQSQTSQYGKKPVVSTSQTGTQFGSGSQFGQNSQSAFGSGSVSTTAKPFGSSYQQTQFGSKPTTTQGSSFTYSQGQTSQFGKKPVVSTTQTGTQFGSGSQFSQNSQSNFGSALVSTTAKPIGSSYQETGSQFGQNVQSSSGAGSVSTTVKPAFGSSYQQTQFGSKPQTTQGSGYTYSQPTSQTSQFGKKPVVSTTQTGTQFGSGSQFSQNSQSIFGSGSVSTTAKPFGSSYQQTQFGSKPSTTQGSSFTYTESQTSQFGKKPVVSTTQTGTQFGSGSQFSQNSQSNFGSGLVSTTAKPIGSSYQQTGSQFGQNVQSSSGAGSVSTTVKPAFGSSYQQTQFGSKPQTTQGSGYTYSQATSQTYQFGKKPVVSTTQTGTQFGSGSQFGQNVQSSSGAGSVSTTVKPAFGSSYQQTQFGSKPSTSQGSSFTYTQSQTSQFGKKPVVSTTQTGTQFGSGSQFSQNSQSNFGSGLVSTTAKPIGSSYQQTGSQFGQNVQSSSGAGSVSTTVKPAFGSSYQQTQFGSKPSTSQGSSFTYTQSQTSQFGKKPVVSTTQTGTQFGSGSQFGQNVQSSSGAGSVSTTVKPAFGSSYQQTQFGSKPSTSQGSSFTYTQSQTSQFGKKPVVSTTQTGTQFGSGSQFSQNSQSNFGSGLVSTTAKPIGSSYQQTGSQFGQNVESSSGAGSVSTTVKPAFGSSYQQTQFGSKPQTTQGSGYTYSQATSQTSQFGKKPVVSTTQTGTQFGSGSQFGQNSQSTQGSDITLTPSKPVVGIKPVYQQAQFGSGGSQFGSNSQSNQGFGSVSTTVKPAFGQTSFGSSSQNSQFGSSGSQFVQKPQTTQGSGFNSNKYSQSQTTQFGKKPETGSTFQQTQFGSTGQFGQKPVTTTITGITSTPGQAAIGQKPFNTGSYYQQSQFGSTGSQFVQKPQLATQGSYSPNTGPAGEAVQTTQFGVAGSSGSGSGNKVSGASSTSGSSFQQTQFAGTSGSQIGQITQYGIKPSSSVQATQGSTQFGSIPSRFGESSQTIVPISTISQIVEPTQFVQKPILTPFGLSTTHFGQKPQAHAFASSTGSNVVPFSSTQTGQVSKYETSQFGLQNQGVVSSTQKPVGSSFSQTNYQKYQYTQTADKSGSQFGQGLQSNVGSGQIGQTTFGAQSQKPFGYQNQQTQFPQGQKPFGSSHGSAFQLGGQSIVDQPTQGTVQSTSITGYNYQKPQSVFTTQYESQSNGAQDQKVQQSQTNFNSAVSTVQTPISGQTFKPVGVPSTQGTFQQSQSTVSSSLFGAQAVKPNEFTGPVIQTSYNKFSGKPFQPASTVSTLGSNVQSQSSAVSTSLFGLPTPSTELAHFSGKPEYTIVPSQGVALNPSVFSSTQAPSREGSNEGLVVSTVQTPIVRVPGYELVINEGTSNNQGLSQSFVGLGEQFGGPRDPPRFDDKTGYHY